MKFAAAEPSILTTKLPSSYASRLQKCWTSDPLTQLQQIFYATTIKTDQELAQDWSRFLRSYLPRSTQCLMPATNVRNGKSIVKAQTSSVDCERLIFGPAVEDVYKLGYPRFNGLRRKYLATLQVRTRYSLFRMLTEPRTSRLANSPNLQ
jgi:hypothetical protein